MSVYRVSMRFPMDSALPRDEITINPHFFGDNPDALVNALKANMLAAPVLATASFTIKAYDAAALPPSYPLAVATQVGVTPGNDRPREIALCVSYYTGFNRPSYRGRLYLPSRWLTGVPGLRPTTTQRDEAIALVKNVLTTNLPASHNWVVWSQKYRKSQGGVSNIWVDDEWDTVRRRGLRPTARTTANVP